MAVGPGSTIAGIPEDIRNHITITGESASVTFDTLSRKKFPPEIYDNEELTPKTEEVRMPYNVIKKVPNGIGKVSKLRNLELQGNDIKKIPKSVGKLKHLSKFDMSKNKIKSVPRAISKANNLETVNLNNNDLRKLPPKVGQIGRQLKILNVSGNSLKKLPKSVYVLRGAVNAADNKISSLPAVTSTKKTKPTVEALYLANNDIEEIPESYSKLMYLLELDLANNKVASLPSTIGNINYLTSLDLRNNEVFELPEDFGRLKYSLQYLNLSGNKLESLPDSVGTLGHLEELNLSKNQIPSIPESISGCRRLVKFDISQNLLDSCNSLSGLAALETANLSSNSISEIAELALESIQEVDLSKNELTSIPSNFGTLGRLKKLILSHNQLVEFPDFLGKENLLESLDLSSNKIEGVVKFDFQNIRMLDELILADNEITALNATINKLEYIRHLDISGNKLTLFFPISPTLKSFNGSNNPWKVDSPQYPSHYTSFILPIVGACEQLETLKLSSCGLETLEEFIVKLLFLQHIDFSNNNLSEISTELINRWRYLRSANLSKNQLSSLPKGIRNMQHLGKLDLRKVVPNFLLCKFLEHDKPFESFNKFTEFDENFKILRALTELRLNNNQISTCPKNFGELKSLRLVDLSHNEIEELPSEQLDTISSLHILKATNNKITVFPENLQHLRLQEIDLSENEIKELPTAIRNVMITEMSPLGTLLDENCEKMNLQNNSLELIPDQIEKMASLRHLNIEGNFLRFYPKCFASGMSKCEILKDNQRSKRKPLADLPEDNK